MPSPGSLVVKNGSPARAEHVGAHAGAVVAHRDAAASSSLERARADLDHPCGEACKRVFQHAAQRLRRGVRLARAARCRPLPPPACKRTLARTRQAVERRARSARARCTRPSLRLAGVAGVRRHPLQDLATAVDLPADQPGVVRASLRRPSRAAARSSSLAHDRDRRQRRGQLVRRAGRQRGKRRELFALRGQRCARVTAPARAASELLAHARDEVAR